MRWPDAKFTLMAVFNTQQLGAVLFPAARLLPQFSGLNGRHQHFMRASSVHFFADNFFNFTQNAQTQRQPGVETGREFTNHTGAHQELVANHHGVGGSFLEGRDEVLAGTHGLGIRFTRGKSGWHCTALPQKRESPTGVGLCQQKTLEPLTNYRTLNGYSAMKRTSFMSPE